MLKLNLVRPENSDIKYQIINFPDGEPHIVLDEIDRKESWIIVKCRISNPSDLYLLLQVEDILSRQGLRFHIQIYYLMSMRMDRVISFNESYSLNLVANLINSYNPHSVTILEPHSDKCRELFRACGEICNPVKDNLLNKLGPSESTIVLPDAGAEARYIMTKPFISCKKKRDPTTGKLLSFELKDCSHDNPELPLMVVDDLCDGGGTFAGIAKLLRGKYPKRELSIFVTHMVNPKGIKTLSENYDHVIFTNSYKDWEESYLPGNVQVIDVIS